MKNIVPRSYKLTDYAGNDGRFKTINPNEAIILSHLPTKWKWIARDKSGTLYLYTVKPNKGRYTWEFLYTNHTKRRDYWNDSERFPYRNLFKCVKWADPEPINIDRLLRDNL